MPAKQTGRGQSLKLYKSRRLGVGLKAIKHQILIQYTLGDAQSFSLRSGLYTIADIQWEICGQLTLNSSRSFPLISCSSLDRAAADQAASGLLWLDAAVQAYMSV